MIMFKLFKKRQNIFIKLIHDQAALTLDGLEALKAYMANQGPEQAALLTRKEKEADEARRILIFELNPPLSPHSIGKISSPSRAPSTMSWIMRTAR
jgi:hypothetical protein